MIHNSQSTDSDGPFLEYKSCISCNDVHVAVYMLCICDTTFAELLPLLKGHLLDSILLVRVPDLSRLHERSKKVEQL